MAGFILGNFNLRVRLLLMLVIVLVLNEGRGNTRAQCIERERQALLRFKQGLVLDPANLLSSWKSSDPSCCSWKGIRCDNRTNHIIMLSLYPEFRCNEYSCFPINYISGKIDLALVELHYLRHLDRFTRIPKFIGSFKRLRYLNFSGNPIIGTIPSQIRNLTRLQFLDLDSYSPMTADDLEWLSYLPSLRSLTLGRIHFTKAVDWLQSIKTANSLSTLNLNYCQFPEIDIWSLSQINSSNSLRSLSSIGNKIHTRTLPWLLNVSRNLVYLTLRDTYDPFNPYIAHQILPQNSFRNLTSLEYVDLSNNGLIGGIPKSWGNLCSLKTLDLSQNSLNGTLHDLLESLTGCSVNSLEILSLTSNQLTGPLPDLSHMLALRQLSIANNQLNDTIPESIGQLFNLRVLDFSSNSFTGVISEIHLQKLIKLEQLALSFNSLTLNFSSNWVPLFQLVAIELSSCKLGPQFPTWIKSQLSLSVIDFHNTSISDTIPNWFCNLTSELKYLNLSLNHITGSLPNFPLTNSIYPIVDLSSNQIHGAIPPSLSNATVLRLSNNKFRSLALFLCTSVERVQLVLDLSNNLLFEKLPDCWKHVEFLSVLNLENNKLFGIIPNSMGELPFILDLRLSRNNFSGDLPSSLKSCTILEVLDVGENNLKGEVPSWIGERLTNLNVLRLKSNKFHGSIPLNLCHLQSIRILDLSFNNISGDIPSCMDNFTFMVQKVQLIPEIYRVSFAGISLDYEVPYDALIMWKGLELHYGKNALLLRMIDLSRNRLTGEIPKGLTNLVELIQLNLSWNNLRGVIPEKIGQLNKLESLDLSHNQLSGNIPISLANIFFLGYLDLSSNHLSGRIPTGTQLQSFNASKYAGNSELCGQPLTIMCPGDESTPQVPSDSSSGEESYDDASGEWFEMSWFRIGIEVGFAVGFCGVCGNLWVNTSWRLAYFRFFNNLGDSLYVRIIVKLATLKRRFSN